MLQCIAFNSVSVNETARFIRAIFGEFKDFADVVPFLVYDSREIEIEFRELQFGYGEMEKVLSSSHL